MLSQQNYDRIIVIEFTFSSKKSNLQYWQIVIRASSAKLHFPTTIPYVTNRVHTTMVYNMCFPILEISLHVKTRISGTVSL